MGSIFISYSHKDTGYAHKLADSLQEMGFEAWIDARLDYGSHWPLEIQKQLDACEAFIVIMSPRAFSSEWVQSELQRAKRKQKPIFPLLLEGDEPWLSVESTQFYDVRGEKLPDAKFFEDLKRVFAVSQSARTLKSPKNWLASPKPEPAPRPGKTLTILASVLATIVICAFCLLGVVWLLVQTFNRYVDSAPTAVSAVPTNPATVESGGQPAPTPNSTKPASTLPEMILIPAGEFSMGSDQGDPDEKPVHQVYLDAFTIDKFEVTNARYKTCVEAGACQPTSGIGIMAYTDPALADFPVGRVDWSMAKTFCAWNGARLPSEAEWEKAARGTDQRTYPWGEKISCEQANILGCGSGPNAVGSHPQGASPFGLEDMAGNVWEWVADFYADTYYVNSPARNPAGSQVGTLRVIRGGGWGYDASYARTTLRYGYDPATLQNDLGFRCARDAQP